MMQLFLVIKAHTKTRVVTTRPTQKNLVPRFRSSREEGGVLDSKTVFLFPGGFLLRMVGPLYFEELDLLTSGGALSFIEDTDMILLIRQVFLEIKRFVVYFADGVLEATPELRNVEDIVNLRKMRG